MTSAIFDSTKTSLQDLLAGTHCGKIQLPDFQRGWVWDDDHIRSLLASVSVSFPIGAVMLLDTGGTGVNFKPRPLTGTKESLLQISPETLILDGQQRLTSLYQALMSGVAVKTKDSKGKPIDRRYYFDMKKALAEEDREDAVLSVPCDGILKSFGGEIVVDVSTDKKEFESDLFPIRHVFNSANWRQAYQEFWKYAQEKMRLYNDFERDVIKAFERYQVPVIALKKDTPKEAVCLVFERVNTGGVALTVFELLTASFAAENFALRDDWSAREKRLKQNHPVLRNLQSDDFLQVISLLVTHTRRQESLSASVGSTEQAPGISCKRRDILKLCVDDWRTWADRVENGFVRAARFLHGQKIFKERDLPYRTQLVPLAAIFVELGDLGETVGARQKIARWFWCGVLGELYGGAIESRFARDLPEVVTFIRNGAAEPGTIQESSFQANRLLTLRTRNSSAYKGVCALLMREGGLDFRTGVAIEAQTFFDDKIDIHHIFPEKWCKNQVIPASKYNSIINKTVLSARTNRKIGGNAPSIYLPAIRDAAEIDDARMNEILESHCILPVHLRADDFWEFFVVRAEALLQKIESVTGMTIARDPASFCEGALAEVYDEGTEEWDAEEPVEELAS